MRPMENDPSSLAGRAETISMGILRSPVMLFATVKKVGELIKQEINEKDSEERERLETDL